MYGYPANYNYQYNQPNTDERIWVQNQSSADAYLVAPNGFVRLWDAQAPRFYEKRADATGRPLPLEVYEYTKKPLVSPTEALSNGGGAIDYGEQISALNKRIEALERALKNEQSDDDDTEV